MNGSPSVADDPGTLGEYAASDGRLLKFRFWQPRDTAKALVVGLHGVQSHSGWYGYSSKALADGGIAVSFLDRRGSGLNQDERGHVINAERLIEDVLDFIRHTGSERADHNSNVPLILLGLSWGARLAAAVCDRHPDLFNGLILLYPGICTHMRPSRRQLKLLRLAQRLGGGKLPVPLPLRAHQFASDPHWQAFIRDDPLSLRRVSVSFVLAGDLLSQLAWQALERLPLPRLVMLAGRDEIVDLPRTRELLARGPQKSLAIIEYAAARHTLEFEPDRDRFVADLISWIESIERRDCK